MLGVECVPSLADYEECDSDVNKTTRHKAKALGGKANIKAKIIGCKAMTKKLTLTTRRRPRPTITDWNGNL